MEWFDKSRPLDSRPRSILECIQPGGETMDMNKYQSYILAEADRSRRRITALVAESYDEEQKHKRIASSFDDEGSSDEVPPLEKRSRKWHGVMAVKEPGGERKVLSPRQSLWWKIYVNNEVLKEEQHYQNKFRARFRLPYQNYLVNRMTISQDGTKGQKAGASNQHPSNYLSLDVEFELYERDASGNVISVKYTGGYVIVDNGYLTWSVTVPPFKVTNDEAEIRWSKWVESMRKDVENTFGILKGRWRILKTGIRVRGVDAVDKIWLTCCALHNWLLDIDGLDEVWVDGVLVQCTSDWTGDLGKHDFEGVSDKIPNAIARLSTNLDPRNYDLSGMGPGDDVMNVHAVDIDFGDDACDDDAVAESLPNTRVVRELGLGFFRRKAPWSLSGALSSTTLPSLLAKTELSFSVRPKDVAACLSTDAMRGLRLPDNEPRA
ncbi:hypothetical protein ACHAWF_014021 [Thalassiosira exigua]